MSILKNTFAAIGVIAVILLALILFLLISIRSCGRPDDGSTPVITDPGHKFRPPVQEYQKPSVRIPFREPKTPVKYKNLPIPPRMIEQSITIFTEGPDGREVPITIIIDTKGRIYKAKNAPDSLKIQVTKWREPLFDIKPRFSYALVWAGDLYNCLSLDLIRLWRIYAGIEVGTQAVFQDFLVGVSGKCGVTDNFSVLAGHDFLRHRYYAGLQFKW